MEHKEETELDLREIISLLFKRKWLIALITCSAVLASGILSYFILTPQYEATAEILVNQDRGEGSFNRADIQTNLELMNTYNVVISSPRILDVVIEQYNLSESLSELQSRVNVQAVRNSQVMSVTVTHPQYEQAVYLVNAIAKTFQTEIVELMNVNNVHIMAEASPVSNVSPVSPRPTLNMAIAFVIGLMVAIGLAFLIEYMDNTLKSEQDIEQLLGIPVLGTITQIEEGNQRKANRMTERSIGGKGIEA